MLFDQSIYYLLSEILDGPSQNVEISAFNCGGVVQLHNSLLSDTVIAIMIMMSLFSVSISNYFGDGAWQMMIIIVVSYTLLLVTVLLTNTHTSLYIQYIQT